MKTEIAVLEHKKKYMDYLRSSEWAMIRADLIALRGCCEQCGSEINLQVHHVSYERLFNEEPEDLALLCKRCHLLQHPEVKSARKKNVPCSRKGRYPLDKARVIVGKDIGIDLSDSNWTDIARELNKHYNQNNRGKTVASARNFVVKYARSVPDSVNKKNGAYAELLILHSELYKPPTKKDVQR